MPPDHYVSRLLSTFTDVDQCETCKTFTVVKSCSECSTNQCNSCYNQHQATHNQVDTELNKSVDLSEEEMKILESIKKYLSEKEFENLVEVARNHLDGAIMKERSINCSAGSDESTNVREYVIDIAEGAILNFSKPEKFILNDIINGKPEDVKRLLRLDFTPRPYQIRMARPGLQRKNSLICLQTGAGKTFVSLSISLIFDNLMRSYFTVLYS